MLYNRTHTKLYVLYLTPYKNQSIDKIKSRCAFTRSNLVGSLIARQFRNKAGPSSSTGLGKNSIDERKEKRSSFFKFFNPTFLEDQKIAEISKMIKSSPDDEKNRIKIAFAEGYFAGQGKKDGNKKKIAYVSVIYKLFWASFLIVIIIKYMRELGLKKLLMGNQHEISPEEIEVTFSDAFGVDEAKEELKEIVEFLRDPEKFSKLGGRLPRGVLLVGPPGTGKTLLARAIAGEAGVPFFHVAGSEFDELLVGQGARRVRDLFAAAKIKSPCVVFIDEIDSVGGKRSNSVIHPYANQTINQLLSEMDGFRQNEGVIVLGATNRRNDLDTALLRPGRFDVEVRVSMPDLAGRKDILNYYLNKLKLAGEIDIEKLAKRTLNFSGADLENMCNQAALRAAIDDEEGVAMKHLENARDKVLMGPEKKRKIPDDEANRYTAYHEAGHALVAYYNENADPIDKITIIPRGESLGHTSYIPDKEVYNFSKARMLAELDTAMGGRVAEELIFGEEKVTTGAYSDLQKATHLAKSMVNKFGMSDQVGLAVHENHQSMYNEISNNTLENIELEVKRLLNESYERAKNTLKTHNKEHHLLAEALLKYETLNLEQLKKVIEGQSLNRSDVSH